jgi:hypothetical protein
MALLSQAPHPNATTVFMNGLLSRKGQITLQKALNTTSRVYKSMREDIPKDFIPLERSRQKGVSYVLMATPERSDNAPVSRLLKKILK